MEKLKIALDWTANTNHTGFFVAKQKGFYSDLGLDVSIITPGEDNYALTPAKKVELGLADFALCPLESIISYRTKTNAFDAIAVAAIFAEDLSAIVSLPESNITSPKDLDGKLYASYKARYEDEIVRQMIKNDGGTGTFKISYPEKLGIWDTLLNKTCDATWIFMNWEGIHAKNKGVSLNVFKMSDYGIPYSYSPVIMASEAKINENKIAYSAFLEATKKGFLFAKQNPEIAVSCIAPFVSETDKDIDLVESQKFTSSYYGDATNWGQMKEESIHLFLNWLAEKDLEQQPLTFADVATNVLL